jgi:RsiW-degrading membrane proteinase PrsW (M82 family)
MADRIRMTQDCDALAQPNVGGERVARLGAGSELPLLRADDREFYKAVLDGRPVFVPRATSTAIDGAFSDAALIVTPGGGTRESVLPAAPAVRSGPWRWAARLLRLLGCLIGISVASTGIGFMIAAAPIVLSPDAAVDNGVGAGVGGALALAGGAVVVRLAYRPLLQFVLLLSGIALAIGGVELLIFAIPLARVSEFDVDQDKARLAMPLAGALLASLGAAIIAVVAVRWWRDPETSTRWPAFARWAAILYGALLALGGPGVGVSFIARAEDYTPTLQDAAAFGASVPLSLVPGALLLFFGLTVRGRLGSGPFRFLPAGLLLALLAASIGLGALAEAVEEPMIWVMSLAHAGAGLLPALVLISLASRGGLGWAPPAGGLSQRQAWLALALGIVVVTTVAGTLDGLIAQAVSTAFLAANGAFDGIRSEHVGDVLRDADLILSDGQLAALLLIVVVAMAPIMEEGFKGLGVALVLPRRPTPSAAFTLGVAVGAGFGVFEGTLYGLGGLAEDSGVDWWAFMLVRSGATCMHALNTGMLGLALYYGRAEGRLSRAFLLYVAAVVTHGLWNGLAVLAGTRLIFSFEELTDRQVAALAFGVLAPLALATLGALYVIARRTYAASPKADEWADEESSQGMSGTAERWRTVAMEARQG